MGDDTLTGALTRASGENVGTYAIQQGTLAASGNYALTYTGANLTINKKALTVTAEAKRKTEGEADPQLTYTVTGLVGSDTLTGTLARQPGEDAGTYDITQGTLAASDNYNISFTKGTLTITAKPVSGHVEVETKTGAGVPPMKVEGLTDELAKKVLTPVELVMMDGGANAHVYVEATNTDGSLSDEIRQRIASALPAGATVAVSMDVSMYKQVGDNLPVKVSGLPAPVTLEFDVSKYGTASADKKRTIFVAHFVKGAWRVEGQSAGPTVTVQVDNLSPFAIAYVDTPIATPEPTAKPTATPKPTAKPTVKPTATPKPTVKPTVTPKPTKQPVESDITLLATMKASGKTDMKLSWTRVKDADGYDIFFRRCGTGDYPLIASVKSSASRSYKVTGLKKATGYKAYVKAWKRIRGVRTYIGKASPTVHAITGGYTKKAANPKTVTVRTSKVTLMIDKSSTIRATVKGVKSGRQVLAHTKLLRYYSSNRNVATVSSTGKIRATGAGSCKIYVVANNGVRTTVKVTVIDGPSKIAFKKSSYSLKKGKTLNLAKQLKLTPSGVTTTYTWNSSDPGIATVSVKGVVKGLKKGTVTITVTSSNGKTASTKIKVKQADIP